MLSKLDAALIVAWLISGAMALENRDRLDISPDTRKATLVPVCRPVMPLPSSLDIGFDPTLVDVAIDCQPA
jgi:hypothetical protein